MRTVALSSGHGKLIRGAAGPSPWGLDEVNEARRIVAEVATQLRALGVTVKGPFNDDVSTSQSENLDRIVNWHNSQGPHDLDVSVHLNAYEITTTKPMGTEVCFVSQEELSLRICNAMCAVTGLPNRGPKYRSDLKFLNSTHEPAVLIETVFCDAKIDCDTYRAKFNDLCVAIAEGITGDKAQEGPPDHPPPLEPPPTEPPFEQRPVIGRGDDGHYVEDIQKSLGLPVDGDFGPVTEGGVKGFQRAWGLVADGLVGNQTWAALDDLDMRMGAGDDGIGSKLAARIDDIVGRSPVLSFSWPNRGQATRGYYEGMAKTFALALHKLRDGEDAAIIMANADTHLPDTDALAWYADEFKAEEMDNSQDGAETLRHLFVMLIGLGMRESSGVHWEGRDMSADNVASDTAEAGLFQTSWNIASASGAILDLTGEYERDPNGFRPSFSKGLSPSADDLDGYGTGDGAFYQWLAKYSPAYAVLMTGVGLRKRRQHWGPINRNEVDIVPMVDDLLIDVERAVIESQLQA